MFSKTLQRLISQVEGARGAAVLNIDGLVIEAVDAQGKRIAPDAALSEYGLIVRQLLDIGSAVEIGDVSHFTIAGEDRITLVRPLDEQYVAALQVAPQATIGKAQFYLRVAAPDLAREI
ncbi:MAG: hypothetical protein KC620_03335 [Myxococcales bacterium]|nr:hypothetical protein [Myxococcales bacterium]